VIPKRQLGRCRRCKTPLTYNILDHPYCERCDCIEIAAVCYHCGAAAHPVYETEIIALRECGPQTAEYWNCPECSGWRVDFEYIEMGSDTSRRLLARLRRGARHFRYAVSYYAERLLGFNRSEL
jgi:hypothetical protein